MSTKVEDVKKNVVKLTIEVDAVKFEEGMNKSFKKNANRFNIPGFRKGKAPRNIVERHYGEGVLYEDAINFVCPDAYDDAVDEKGIYPVDRPEIDIVQVEKGKELIFTATVTVKPEVELGEYKGVKATKVEATVTDEDIEKEIQTIADRNARIITVEDRPVQNDDTVIIDFEGFVDDIAFEGGKADGFSLVIGSGQFIDTFEEQLIGAELGSDLDVNVKFPDEYGKEELAGKPALFKVKINEIKSKELPEIDDEFVKDVSEFDTLDEYKEDTRKRLTEAAEKSAKSQTENNVMDKVAEGTKVDIPEVMIKNKVASLIKDFEMNLMYQGMKLDKYLEMIKMTKADLEEQYKERAEKEVKIQLILEKIGETEKMEVTDQEIEAKIEEIAKTYKKEKDEFIKTLKDDDYEYFKNNIIMEKTIDFLIENAKLGK